MLRLAKILKSNGTNGGLLIGLLDIRPDDIDTTEPVFVTFDGIPVPFFIQDIRPKGSSGAIIHLNDVHNLKDSEEMVGRFICIDADEEDDEDSVIGWEVYDGDTLLGNISDLEMIPGNTCLCIERPDGTQLLVPYHEDLVTKTERRRKRLFLSLPSGLY